MMSSRTVYQKNHLNQINGCLKSDVQDIFPKAAGTSTDHDILDNKSRSVDEETYEWRRGPYEGVYTPAPWYTKVTVLLCYALLLTFGAIADWLRSRNLIHAPVAYERKQQKDFVSLDNPFETVFVNNLYRKGSDVVNRPLAGVPAAVMTLADRVTHDYGWSYEFTGKTVDVINMGSYNYLGFSRADGPCAEAAARAVDVNGIGVGSTRHEFGNVGLHRELEVQLARFLGVEDAICFAMGFATNSMNIPCFIGKDGLILSDEFVHASLVLGCRLSGATIKVFKHNDVVDMENKLARCLLDGHPKTGAPFRKILIVIEGIYSMEGTIVNLPAFLEVKRRYNAYIFVDEAHSIGSLGPSGRGVVEYWGCDPNEVDIMMGTLTKSFAAAGGYIGGRKKTIDYLRACSHCACYGAQMSPPIATQVLACVKKMLDGRIARGKARQLSRNTRYIRARLKQLGFLIYGHDDSPVVPVLTFSFTRGAFIGRESLKRGVALVSVAYPAAPLAAVRMRLCISADHTKEQLDEVIRVMDEVGDQANVKYCKVDKSGHYVEY